MLCAARTPRARSIPRVQRRSLPVAASLACGRASASSPPATLCPPAMRDPRAPPLVARASSRRRSERVAERLADEAVEVDGQQAGRVRVVAEIEEEEVLLLGGLARCAQGGLELPDVPLPRRNRLRFEFGFGFRLGLRLGFWVSRHGLRLRFGLRLGLGLRLRFGFW